VAAGVAVLASTFVVGFLPVLVLGAAAIVLYLSKPRGSGKPLESGSSEWSARRRGAAIAVAAGAFLLLLSLFWTVFLFGTTEMGECEFEEVHCSSLGEFMAVYGYFFYLALLPPSVVLAWAIVPRLNGSGSKRAGTSPRRRPNDRTTKAAQRR